MRTRALTLVALMLLMLAAAPQFEAMPTGIGAAGDNGCTCHGGASGDTSVDRRRPSRHGSTQAKPTPFTVTVVNDAMELAQRWQHRRSRSVERSTQLVSESSPRQAWSQPSTSPLSHDMDGGLTHTAGRQQQSASWDFEWVAPGR